MFIHCSNGKPRGSRLEMIRNHRLPITWNLSYKSVACLPTRYPNCYKNFLLRDFPTYWLIITLLPCTFVVICSVAHNDFSLGRNWTRYPVSEKDFRSAYLSVCSNGRSGLGATNLNDVRFLPLLFVVLAISVRLAPEHLTGDSCTRRITSLRYYWSCVSPILSSFELY